MLARSPCAANPESYSAAPPGRPFEAEACGREGSELRYFGLDDLPGEMIAVNRLILERLREWLASRPAR